MVDFASPHPPMFRVNGAPFPTHFEAVALAKILKAMGQPVRIVLALATYRPLVHVSGRPGHDAQAKDGQGKR